MALIQSNVHGHIVIQPRPLLVQRRSSAYCDPLAGSSRLNSLQEPGTFNRNPRWIGRRDCIGQRLNIWINMLCRSKAGVIGNQVRDRMIALRAQPVMTAKTKVPGDINETES